MMPVPWRYVKSWNCIACGLCCKEYNVVLTFTEWLNIVKNYGVSATVPGINKFFLKRKSDGSCIFLQHFSNTYFCGLQPTKPRACKLWPFKVFSQPKFGKAKEATYTYNGRKFYMYLDPFCLGITWGTPTQGFMEKTLREFVEIALGLREKQYYTTSQLLLQPTLL